MQASQVRSLSEYTQVFSKPPEGQMDSMCTDK